MGYNDNHGRRFVCHIAFDMLHEVWDKVTYDWSTALCLCLCLCQPRFH